MKKKLFTLSQILLGSLLLLLIVLTSVIGAEESVLRIVGYITLLPLISTLVLGILTRKE